VNAISGEPRDKRALEAELRKLLGVGETMAKALAASEDFYWQEKMLAKYGDGLSHLERDDLLRRIRLDPDEDEKDERR
jgi:hypothetical protein